MKETKIEIPAGCEVEKTEVVDGALVVTFKPKGPKLPRTWEEFCSNNLVNTKECYVGEDGFIHNAFLPNCRSTVTDRKLLPDRKTAEAALALCQLIQLRECYNQGWKPDWNGNDEKYCIELYANEVDIENWKCRATSPLFFKTEELRDFFFENFRELVEKLKPLYGIMKGGEK